MADYVIASERRADWRLVYMFSIASRSWMIHLGVVTLVFMVIADGSRGDWPALWFASMGIGTIAALMLGITYDKVASEDTDVSALYGWMHTGITALIGTTWASGAIMLASQSSEMFLFYTLALGGTALGAVSSQNALMRSCMTSIWTSMPGLAIAHYLHAPGFQGIVAAVLMLLFAMMLTVTATRLNRFLRSNRSLAEELDRKVVEVSEARKAAEEANASKSRLLAQASHDLRQPVHAIGLLTESLRDRVPDADGKAILERIDASVGSLSRLFRSLLDISALDVGRVRPDIGTFALETILDDVVRQNAAEARRRSVRLRHVPTSLWVRSDPALLQAMIQNLVSNAVKYAPGARVVVGARRDGAGVRIEVHDAGPGIEADDQQRIFDEFVRLAKSGDGTDGIGLGLSIVERLAQLLGLAVSVRSRPGQGSCFVIAGLTRAPATVLAPHTPPAYAGRPSLLQGLHLLVVDDDDVARTALTQLLARWGCGFDAAAAPPAEAGAADFILMDHELGGGRDGLSAIAQLREAAGRAIPAALITGTSDPDVEARAAAQGVVFLPKPVRPAQLRSLLLTAASGQAIHTRPASAAVAAAAARDGTSSARRMEET